jgi:transcriptional antiterminator NusG
MPMSTNLVDAPASAQRVWQVESAQAAVAVRWHVLQTKSRQEKVLAENLGVRGIECFLPLVDVSRMHGGRRAKVELPLFPGYLFIRGTLEDVYMADRTKRVARVISVFDQTRLAEELTNVKLALRGAENGTVFDPFPYLRRGIRVEVISGPMRGVRGVIEDRRKRDRLILQVDVLGKATSLEVDSALLAPIGEF